MTPRSRREITLNARAKSSSAPPRNGAGTGTPVSGLPEAFVRRLSSYTPELRLPGILASFSLPRRVTFRINPLVGGGDVLGGLQARGLHVQPLPWPPGAFVVAAEQRDALLEDESVQSGGIYVQNASSMVPVGVLDPQPGEKVLDLAAAPGSKTIQIAGCMGGAGELAAVEVVKKRFFRMKALLRRHGASFVRTFHQDGTRVWRYRPDYFDRVLLDAPCSTEGRFVAGEPSTTKYWSKRKIGEMAHRQRMLAESAVRCLRPGGVLVYSTCTTAPEENEGTVSWLLERFQADLVVEEIDLPAGLRVPAVVEWQGQSYDPSVAASVRIAPDDTFEAFFVCRLRRK